MPSVTDRVVDQCVAADPGGVIGLYLHGSSTLGGLRPDSDIDLLLVTRRSLSTSQRVDITDLLLGCSGARAVVEPGRPVELTSVVVSALRPWVYPPVCDYTYGEWLRDDIAAGLLPSPHTDPDLAIVLSGARSTGRPLLGPPLAAIADAVPSQDLRRAIGDSLDPLLSDLDGDERNVLLTLARMLVSLDSGRIVAKDEAARRVKETVPATSRAVLDLALHAYLGEVTDDWSQLGAECHRTATLLATSIRAALSRG